MALEYRGFQAFNGDWFDEHPAWRHVWLLDAGSFSSAAKPIGASRA
jgi:hypothetical protein